MFILSYAGYFYGPFNSANEAAEAGRSIPSFGPWQIIKLRAPIDASKSEPQDKSVTINVSSSDMVKRTIHQVAAQFAADAGPSLR